MGLYDPAPADGATGWGNWLRGGIVGLDNRTAIGVLAVDTLPGADGALGNTETGQTWQVLAGTAARTSGRLACTGTTTAVFDVGTPDVDASAIVVHTGGSPGIVFRSDTANTDRLGVQLDATNGFRLQKLDTNVGTVLAQVPFTFTTDGSVSYRLRVVASGDMVRAYLDGELLLTYQLTSAEQSKYAPLTRVGFRTTTSGGSFDYLAVRQPDRLGDVSPMRQVSGPYTLVRGDMGSMVEQTSASAAAFTVPANVFPPGASVYLIQYGAGAATVAAGSGLTLRNAGAIGGQYYGRSLYFRTTTEAVLL